ncbi:hypothetical protein vseg_014425 [Gypsophila vaccaria]
MPGFVGGDHNNNNQESYFSLSSDGVVNGSVCRSSNGFWSKHRGDINHHQLQKFWSELSPQARQELLKIDKQTLFEQARKNMYCSRCNGLLLEGFMQIVMYGKSLQHEGGGGKLLSHRLDVSKNQGNGVTSPTEVCQDETQDPSVHPWGGLITTRDGALTLLDSYLYSKSLKGLQNVFDSARARERERELLYPDACGGGGRGWISHGIPSYGRGHGTRETCALHTARLSCDTLVDFWSALGEETRHSLLRMKEEDFIERLMYRFDSKRFCRDCRRNVIREFKELKELKRMRREPRCTNWFCGADTAFQYEVSNDTIYADWHQAFVDSIGTYGHFEWAVGTGEGKSDILEFENVGMNGSVRVNGLDLAGLTACFITLRAYKLDGRGYTEFSVKAHALKERQCVHCRLVVGDGYVTITRGESIRRFFEHAEEAEEEEDDDSIDKDGNDMDAECSRPQKHAKSPELAREFLLDAATVIFKEQVEKAFREGTARQNAHSIFVCLALKLLEERIQVACKEIITLEKQMKLLEEEEKEKREEEERKERKRTKEREKKLRRKERMRGKDKDKKCSESSGSPLPFDALEEMSTSCIDEDAIICIGDSVSEAGDTNLSNTFTCADEEYADDQHENGFTHQKCSDRRHSMDNGAVSYKSESRYHGDVSENNSNGLNNFCRPSRAIGTKFSTRSNGLREPFSDLPKPVHRIKKFNQVDHVRDSCGRARSKIFNYTNALGRDLPYTKKVWEPVEPHKRSPQSNSDVTSKSCSVKIEEIETVKSISEVCSSQTGDVSTGDAQGDGTSCKYQMESKEAAEENDFSASSSSSSDNCSSCLSEGDSSNTPSSNHQTLETSSTSDSEDSSQQSEERLRSDCCQNGLPDEHDVENKKMLNLKGEEAAHSSPLSENAMKGKLGPGIASVQPQGVLPSLHNQNIPFPIFQGPSTVGYYHQSPVAWSTSPANGLTTYGAHPNHYILPSPFGYGGLNGDSHVFMQYAPVQHLSSPFVSSNPIPVYQPFPRNNCLNPQDQTGGCKANGVKDPFGESIRDFTPTDVAENASLTKLETGNMGSSFSLFQYGGPVALPTCRSSIQSSDDGEHACSKKETAVEEYKLFSARNGLQFSIF